MFHNKQGVPGEGSSDPALAGMRVAIALSLPIVIGVVISILGSGSVLSGDRNNQSATVLLLGPVGITSWLLGVRWYGLPGLGLRGHRPLYAGIGFAILGWIAFLIGRILFVRIQGLETGFREFIFLLMFEAFCIQLWLFGLLFRSVADWRGPLTAAIVTGLIFGAAATLLFRESFVTNTSSLAYFSLWGVFYGVVRLRTGSILGVVIVQAIQSFTGWVALSPMEPGPDAAQLQKLYLATSAAYLVIIWRLWPKREEDYRV